MTVENLLFELEKVGGRINLVNGELKMSVNGNRVDLALIERIKSKRSEIIEFIENQKKESATGISAIEEQEYYDVYPNQVGLCVLFRHRNLFKKNKLEKLNQPANILITIEIKKFDLPTFKRTLLALVTRYESLRTNFLFIGDRVKQRILDVDAIKLPYKYIDLRKSNSKEALLDQYKKKYVEKQFNICKALLFDVVIIRIGDECYKILFVINHLIADDFSCNIIIDESTKIYTAFSNNQVYNFNVKNVQAKDYGAWVNNLLKGEHGHRLRRFWRERLLHEMPTLTLQKYYKPSVDVAGIERSYLLSLEHDLKKIHAKKRNEIVNSIRGAIHRIYVPDGNCFGFYVDDIMYGEMSALCRLLKTTMNNLVNACIFLLIHKLTGRNDIILCVIAMIRENYDLREIIGWLTTGILFRNKLHTHRTIADFISGTQAEFLAYYQYKHFGVNQVLDDLDISLDVLGLVSINYIHRTSQFEQIPADFRKTHLEGDSVMCDMDFCVYEYKNCMKVYISYRTDRFEPHTIEYFSDCFLNVCACAARHANDKISDAIRRPS